MVAIYQIANNLKQENIKMDTPAFFSTVFIACLLLSITGYSIYVGFGPPSQDLRDPFQEHED
jgi:PsbN protein